MFDTSRQTLSPGEKRSSKKPAKSQVPREKLATRKNAVLCFMCKCNIIKFDIFGFLGSKNRKNVRQKCVKFYPVFYGVVI